MRFPLSRHFGRGGERASRLKFLQIPWHLVVIFFILSIAIGITGYLYYKSQKEHIKKDRQNELSAIADLKVSQIVNWRKERMGDAEVISNNPLIVPHIQQWLKSKSPELKKEIYFYMKSLQEYYQYKSVVLLDTKGNTQLAVPDGKEVLGPDAKRLAEGAIHTNKIVFSDLYRSKITNVIRLTLVIPLLAQQKDDTLPIGAFLLRVDPYLFLYPLIQSWPTPSSTSETVLVRREENDVVILNKLRHRKDIELTLHTSISDQQCPAAMAARGIKGVVEGIDYRGVPVIAAIQAIPDSPWFLVAKVDKEEIYAPIREHFWAVTIVVSLLIIGSGVSVGLFWRHQQAQFYRRQYETELERQVLAKRYEYLTKYANDIILLLDQKGKIVDANERAITSYGYTCDELLQLDLGDIRAPEARATLVEQMKQIEQQNGLVFVTLHQRKDATIFPVEVSSRIIEVEGKAFYQNIIRDITDRKHAEEELRKVNRALKAVRDCNQVLVRVAEESQLLNEVCNIIVKTGGYLMSWVGFAEQDEGKTVRPVAQAGYEEGYLETINITWADTEQGRGPTGIAIRTGKPCVARDILTDPNFRPWRTEAVKRGYASSIAIPLITDGITLGALNIYAKEPDAFDAEEAKLLTELADDLAYGIMALRTRIERKRAEEELRKHREHLEELVEARTAQLEAANKELEAFSYSVSHDLRAPLRAIDGFSRILLEDYYDKLDDEGKRLLNIIRSNTNKMGQLIDDLLALSRVGRKEIELSNIDMDSLAKAVFDEIKTTIPERKLQFNVKPLPPACGDLLMIHQVFVNLLSNALKFTRPKDTAIIEVSGWSEQKENVYYVRDNGVGFDMQYVSKLFGEFQRLHSSEEFEGTGIGLAIVHRIIHRHGGRVWAEGKMNEGATFYFTLPKKDYPD